MPDPAGMDRIQENGMEIDRRYTMNRAAAIHMMLICFCGTCLASCMVTHKITSKPSNAKVYRVNNANQRDWQNGKVKGKYVGKTPYEGKVKIEKTSYYTVVKEGFKPCKWKVNNSGAKHCKLQPDYQFFHLDEYNLTINELMNLQYVVDRGFKLIRVKSESGVGSSDFHGIEKQEKKASEIIKVPHDTPCVMVGTDGTYYFMEFEPGKSIPFKNRNGSLVIAAEDSGTITYDGKQWEVHYLDPNKFAPSLKVHQAEDTETTTETTVLEGVTK